MFEQLNKRFARIIKDIKGQGKISDKNISESLRNVRRALLEADVNFQVAKSFINRVKDKASGDEVFTSVTPGQQFIQILEREMASFLGDKNDGIQFHSSGKTVILLVGLQGSGKTTTAVKLACFLKKRWQKNPYLIGAAAGAVLGATIAMLILSLSSVVAFLSVSFFAFIGSLTTVLSAYLIARSSGGVQTYTLILSGIALGSFAAAIASFSTPIFSTTSSIFINFSFFLILVYQAALSLQEIPRMLLQLLINA